MIPIHRVPDAFIVPATAEDIAAVYGKANDATVRAWALRWRGETVAVAGLGANQVIFSNVREDTPKLLVAKAMRAFLTIAANVVRRPLIAYPGNRDLLIGLGFEGPRVINGHEMFIFTPERFRAC